MQYYRYGIVSHGQVSSKRESGSLHMKYTKEVRLYIGHRIYADEFTIYTASEQFGVSVCFARDYMEFMSGPNHFPAKTAVRGHKKTPAPKSQYLQNLEAMDKRIDYGNCQSPDFRNSVKKMLLG